MWGREKLDIPEQQDNSSVKVYF